jgi:hypothetical protein
VGKRAEIKEYKSNGNEYIVKNRLKIEKVL